MSRATRDSAATRALIARVEARATGRLSVSTEGVEVSLHLLAGDLIAATTEDDDLLTIRMLARCGVIDDDEAIRLEDLQDSGGDVFSELLRHPQTDELLRERFRQNVADYLASGAAPRFFDQRTVMVANIQMGHETRRLIEELCVQCDLARAVDPEMMVVRGLTPPGPDRVRQQLASAAGPEPRSIATLIEDLPLEPMRARVLAGQLLKAGVLALPGVAPEVEIEVEPSEEVPYDEDDTLSTEGAPPEATPTPAPVAAPPVSRATPPPAAGRPVPERGTPAPGSRATPVRIPESSSEETVPLSGLLAERIAASRAASRAAGSGGRPASPEARGADPATVPLDRSAARPGDPERTRPLDPERTPGSRAADAERTRALDPDRTVIIERPARPELRSTRTPEGATPRMPLAGTPIPIARLSRATDDDDEDVEDAYTEQIDRSRFGGAAGGGGQSRSLADWLNRTETVGEEELGFFSDHDHERGGDADGRFSDHTLETIEVTSMSNEAEAGTELLEADDAQIGKYGAPMLSHGDAVAKIEVTNEVLSIVASSFDQAEGYGRGRAVMQLLVDGVPNQFAALLHDLRVSDTGELPIDHLMRNLHHRPVTEHRQLLNNTLVDVIERALSAAADELPEDALDEVLENVAGYRQRLGL